MGPSDHFGSSNLFIQNLHHIFQPVKKLKMLLFKKRYHQVFYSFCQTPVVTRVQLGCDVSDDRNQRRMLCLINSSWFKIGHEPSHMLIFLLSMESQSGIPEVENCAHRLQAITFFQEPGHLFHRGGFGFQSFVNQVHGIDGAN